MINYIIFKYILLCLLLVNEIYYFKKFTIGFSNENFNTLKNCYQIVLTKESTLKKFIDEVDLEYTIKKNLTEIKNIPNLSENEIISKLNYIISKFKINIVTACRTDVDNNS